MAAPGTSSNQKKRSALVLRPRLSSAGVGVKSRPNNAIAATIASAPVAVVTRGAGRSSCNRWPIAVATWAQRSWWRDSEAAAASLYATTPLYIEHHAVLSEFPCLFGTLL